MRRKIYARAGLFQEISGIAQTNMNDKSKASQTAALFGGDAGHDFAFSLVECLAIPTFIVDRQCRVLIWNQACEKLTGIAASEVLGTSNHWRGFYKTQRPCLADLIAQERTREIDGFYPEHGPAAEPKLGIYVENWCMMPQHGTRLYLAIDARPLYNSDGDMVAVVETVRDLTLQKLAQTALQDMSSQDGLTGLANRRSFDLALKLEWRRMLRDSQPLSLLKIDIDHFKLYNDTYGHLAGDECLKQLASAILDQLKRASDTASRFEGAQFAVILPNNALDGAVKVAERILASIAKLALPFTGSQSGRVSVSIGVACSVAMPIIDSWQLISTADAALYEAKERGRNRLATLQVEPLGTIQS
jgi:diguanylate cyclase (GGDEF)-like protein/PAS domain S-box-containing protein